MEGAGLSTSILSGAGGAGPEVLAAFAAAFLAWRSLALAVVERMAVGTWGVGGEKCEVKE